MARQEGEFLAGEDLDDLYLLIDGGYLDDDADFNIEMDAALFEVSDVTQVVTFKCSQCEKIYKSRRGLTRHENTTHHDHVVEKNEELNFNLAAERDVTSFKKLSLLQLSATVKKSASIVAADMCLPESPRKVFESLTFSFEESNKLWDKVRPVSDGFKGNAEKCYAEFYG